MEHSIPHSVRSAEAWAHSLFSPVELSDPRRKRRLLEVATACISNPGSTFAQSFSSSSQIKGAYRLVANQHISSEALTQSMWNASLKSCQGHSVIYAIQDTTELDFSHHTSMEGRGPIGNDSPRKQGVYLHSALAVRPDGMPIGLLHHQVWARDPDEREKRHSRKQRSIEEKESFKWIRTIRECANSYHQMFAAADGPRLIFIGDRESDIHEVFEKVQAVPHGAIVRASWNRRIEEAGHLWEYMAAQPVQDRFSLDVRAQANRKARTAVLDVRWSRVTLNPDSSRNPRRKPVELHAVWACEASPPLDGNPIEWMLLTTEPVETMEQARAVLDAYRLRWRIEELHLILKSGCRIEQVQYRSRERLEKILPLLLASAIRILLLRSASDLQPDAPATSILDEAEEKALCIYLSQHYKHPVSSLTVVQALFWMGRMGGHMGRKSDGRPGVRTLWRGCKVLESVVAMFRAMHSS